MAGFQGYTLMEVEMEPAPLSPPALPDQMGISLPGTSYLTTLMGVEPSPGFTGTPWEPENFQGRGKYQPSGRYRPSTLVETGRFPTGHHMDNHTAPKSVAGYGGVST